MYWVFLSNTNDFKTDLFDQLDLNLGIFVIKGALSTPMNSRTAASPPGVA